MLRHDGPGLDRQALSTLLLGGMLRAAGLDLFECGDVFNRVAESRSESAALAHTNKLVSQLRRRMSIVDLANSNLSRRAAPPPTPRHG